MSKKLKKWRQLFYSLLLIVLIMGFGEVRVLAACSTNLISGPLLIQQGTATSYSIPTTNRSNFQWGITTAGSGISLTNANNSTCSLTASNTITTCQITIQVVYDTVVNGNTTNKCAQKDIFVIPSISSPNCIFPGETATIGLNNPCFTSFSWDVSPSSVTCSCSNSSTNFINVSASLNPMPTAIAVKCTVSTSTPQQLNGITATVNIPVCLHNPTSISGPNNIGCPGSTQNGNLTYTAATVVGATSYTWWVDPAFFAIVSGQGTQSITLTATAPTPPSTSGLIKVKAVNGSVESSETSFPLTVCCISNVSVTTNVNTSNTDTKQSGAYLDASNTISNGASARYHAGTEVKLSPGFVATNGCYFHGYIAQCTGTFYKDAIQEPEQPTIEGTSVSASREISIFPNPSNSGIFTVKTYCKDKGSIEIYNILGSRIYQQNMRAKTSEHIMDISQYPKGMYIVRMLVDDEPYSQKIIIE